MFRCFKKNRIALFIRKALSVWEPPSPPLPSKHLGKSIGNGFKKLEDVFFQFFFMLDVK